MRRNPYHLWHASEAMQGDREIVMEAVSSKQRDPNPNNNSFVRKQGCKPRMESLILYVDVSFLIKGLSLGLGSLSFASEAVKRLGLSLLYASAELQADRGIVTEAVRQDGTALRYASRELKGDRDVVMEAVKRSGSSLKFASDRLKVDKELVMAAFEW